MTRGNTHRQELPEATRLFRVVLALTVQLRARMDTRLSAIDVTTQQAAVLTVLETASTAPTQGELAALLGTTHQNVRQLLDVLVRKRLVEVVVDPSDRRARRVSVTPAVRRLFAGRDRGDHRAIRSWFAALTDKEVTQATALLRKAYGALRDADRAHRHHAIEVDLLGPPKRSRARH